MSRLTHKLALLLSLVLLAISALAAQSMAQEPVTLTYSNFFPPTHVQSKLAEAWCQEVTRRTDGLVKFQYLPGGTLLKAEQTYDGVVSGLCDVGMSCFGYTRGRFPVMEVVDLPLGYANGVMATAVANQLARELAPQELRDSQVMYLHAHGPGLLHTRKQPVRHLDDLKGLKIRAHGTTAAMVKALGATPVAMPMPETYQALEKGVVDGSLYPVESNLGWKLAEVTTYATRHLSVAYTTSFFVVMNKDKWRALPETARQVIAQINQEWAVRHGQAWDESDQRGREFFLSLPGREYIELSAEESARWRQAVQPVMDDYAGRMRGRNLDGGRILETARRAVAAAAK